MRVPLAWLRDYVVLPEKLDLSELTDRLDMSGTKVEEVHRLGAGVGGVVVAEVLDIVKHPDADSLSLVEVKTEAEGSETVVCGASNFTTGDLVPYAPVGARLPSMEITERKIRGQVSRGMLCSGAELGISKDHSGILVLPPDSPLGEDVSRLLDLEQPVIELEITPNRPDCMSMIGIAREMAALYRTDLKIPDVELVPKKDRNPVRVEIKDQVGCPRYLARYLDEVSVRPSPMWLAARLLASGFRPISNVVDATNYVLLETGQPLHAFDAAKIASSTIIVRRAGAGENITTLDGENRKLDAEDLVIADPQGPVAIAGVMGAAEPEVTDSTDAVILESAAFDKTSISFTSRRLGLRSEASARFERGSDAEAVPFAAARACELIQATAGASVVDAVVDEYPRPVEPEQVRLRPGRTEALLGTSISAGTQIEHLRSIGLEAVARDEAIEVIVPTFRRDLHIEADLIEEVARLEGFDRLPSTLPKGQAGGLTQAQKTDRLIRWSFVLAGVTEAWTGSFSSPEDLDALGYPEDHPGRRMVELQNPMLDSEPALRTTLLPGLLKGVSLNHSTHRPAGVALFEIARVYQPATDGTAEEAEALSAVFSGVRREQSWRSDREIWDLFTAKGVLSSMATAVGVENMRLEAVKAMPYHPTRGAIVLIEGEPAGTIGELHPDVCARFDVPEGAVALEVSVEAIVAAQRKGGQVGSLPRFPSVYIDLAFVVDSRVAAGAVEDLIAEAGGSQVVSTRLFDLYEGPQVPDGKKSLAFALEIRDDERTLEEDDIASIRDRIVNVVGERLGGELRA